MDFSSAVLTREFPGMIIGTVLLRGLIERTALRAGKHNRDLRSTGHPANTRPRFGRFRDRRRREHNVNLITFADRQPSYSSKAGHIGVQDGKQIRLSDNCQRGRRSRVPCDHIGMRRALRFRTLQQRGPQRGNDSRNPHRRAGRHGFLRQEARATLIESGSRSSGMLALVSPSGARVRCLLGRDRNDPSRWVARLNFHYRADHPRDRQSIQHHCRPLAPVLGAAAAPGLYQVSNFDSLHASPKLDGTRDNSATIRRI